MNRRTVLSAGLGLLLTSHAREFAWADDGPVPMMVRFGGPSPELVGYLFAPAEPRAARCPAVVLMHGRAGAYSTLADGVYDASTLSKRHRFWGRFWAGQGYVALLVDGFGPRGYPGGFPAHSYDERPEAVNEVTVRPLDAYAALAYLRTRPDIDHSRIALQGWSNGGSATLASMADVTLATVGLSSSNGFRGGIAFYPACGLQGRFDGGIRPYAPVLVLSGDADEEVSAARCGRLVDMSRRSGGDISIVVYPGATHDFDDPGRKRQSVEANVEADADAIQRAQSFMRKVLLRA